jgi:hypothetical protein
MTRTPKKVEVELIGGIGNQLFGYFAGRYLAKANSSVLHLRIMKPNVGETVHNGTIRELNLDGLFQDDNRGILKRFFDRMLDKMSRSNASFDRINSNLRNRYYSKTLGFDPKIESLRTITKISGYFQTWKYFAEFQDEIREEIEIVAKSKWYSEWRCKAIEERVVIVHIRAGDYLEKQNNMFGSLSSEYYERALNRLPATLSKNPIWVFSDNIKFAQTLLSNLKGFNFVWIEPPPATSPIESLMLMTVGAANIIANSTYSWWGAMLNNRKPFIVAPSKWFKLIEDPSDLIPDSWIRINSTWR